MRAMTTDVWTRRGISLLWDPYVLAGLCRPEEVFTMRQLFSLVGHWEDDLPSNRGRTLVVAGLEGCMDMLVPDEAEDWLESEVRGAMLSFQEEYSLEAALVFWLPTGGPRVGVNPASEDFYWRCSPPYAGQTLDLGRILFSGAAVDAVQIQYGSDSQRNDSGMGINCPRVS